MEKENPGVDGSVGSNESSVKNEDYVEVSFGKTLEKLRANPWILSTTVLAIVLIVVLAIGGGNGGIGAEKAGQNVVNFVNSQGQGEASLVSAEAEGSLYKVTVSYEGQDIPVYTTLDGESLISGLVPLGLETEEETVSNEPVKVDVPQTDKPVVELFVMSHCPYGTQAEKAMLPVVEALGDKIEFDVRFVYYAMHGEVEVLEQTNQYCIQEEQNDKFIDYLSCFLEDGDGERCLGETGIDIAKMEACVAKADAEFDIMKNLEDESSWLSGRFPLFDVHADLNDEYSIGGSPTLVVNGVEVSGVARTPASYLSAVCQAFNDEPAECDVELSSDAVSAGFGYGGAGSASASAGCGA